MSSRLSLNQLFMLRLVPLALLVALAVSLASAWHLHKRFEGELERKETELLRIGASLLAAPLWNFDNHAVDELVDTLLADADVSSVSVYDDTDTLILSRHNGHDLFGLKQRRAAIIFENALLRRHLGHLELTFTRQRLSEQIGWSIFFTLLAVALVVVAVLAWTMRFNRLHVVAPLNAILDTLRAMRSGQPFVPVVSGAPGEVGAALHAYNSLAVQLDHAHQEIAAQSQRDALTGLLNRHGFYAHLSHWLETHPQRPLGLLHMDINHFRWINESFGQDAGSQLLCDIATRLEQQLIPQLSLPLARLGSDEFVAAFADIDSTGLARQARDLQRSMLEPFEVFDQQVFVSMNLGGALFPQHAATAEGLLKVVELALHRGKGRSPGEYRLYQPSTTHLPAHQMIALERDLHRALNEDGLRLMLQPIVTADSIPGGRVTLSGVETLVRIEHPEHGVLSPDTFIPVAEASGLILPLGAWVMEQGLAWLAAATRQGLDTLTLSFNVSAREIHAGGLVERLAEGLARHALAPHRIILEVTENLMLERDEVVLETFNALRSLGCRLAIDDFGTGFSSMSYLQHLPFDIVKIDRCFVSELHTEPRQAALVAAMIEMGHALGLSVTVEGIELNEQARCCLDNGADHLQGYYFCRPVPAQEALARFITL
ncbi:diguanylate cyclase (GGDEF) domain-containing protein [Franzmannia pantelleriensis]|uniref:Diguanylate cyclase (GGDEF) domain-containing protein n=1 Tax=Franzmannia pantelleriensis TaxID=48727 RepID=A0A1G9EZC4_9GAMM|nr:bifunctional diguanylate cyclase/phosphodiesterase [Halomonas pantelleriensis]SDK81539.1 diguanylate cyclase (GGDEF) domain-containing protein [Halomonas pantelleriensis]